MSRPFRFLRAVLTLALLVVAFPSSPLFGADQQAAKAQLPSIRGVDEPPIQFEWSRVAADQTTTPHKAGVLCEGSECFEAATAAITALPGIARLHIPVCSTYVSGRVTRAGRPVSAHIRFLTGDAFSDPATGRYVALLPRLPDRSPVYVVACDDSFAYVHVPRAPIPNGAGYDFEIPANEIRIEVQDQTTSAQTQTSEWPSHREWVFASVLDSRRCRHRRRCNRRQRRIQLPIRARY